MLCIRVAYATLRCLSVRPPVCSRSCIVSKRVIISSKVFLSSGSHTILVFPHQTLWQYSDGDPLAGTEIVIIDQYLALVSMTGVVLSVLNSADRAVKFIAGDSDDEVTKRHARINESCL